MSLNISMRVPVRSTKCRKMGNHDIPDLDTFKVVIEVENAFQKEEAALSFLSTESESSAFPGEVRPDTDSTKKFRLQSPRHLNWNLRLTCDVLWKSLLLL